MPVASSSSRSPLLIAIIGVALMGLVVLNIFQERNDPKYQEKMERERSRQQQAEAAKKQQGQPGGAPSAPMGAANELANLGSDAQLGNPKGEKTVTLGWRWTPEVQGDPNKIYGMVEALKNTARDAKIRVVNLDANPGAVPEGVAIAGKAVVPLGADGGLSPQAIGPVAAALSGGGPPGPPPQVPPTGPPPPGPAPAP